MKLVSDPPPALAAVGGTAPSTQRWRASYWKLRGRGRKALGAIALRRRLRSLRRQALAAPRYQPGSLRLDGYRIHYDDLLALYMEYKHIFAWGIYDFRACGPRPRVLDCGSHIGLSVLRFKRLAPDARVLAFEPDPNVLALLRRNIEDNGLTDVQVIPAAVGGARGMGQFVADGADGGALARGASASPQSCTVSTVPLADYLTEPVELLKLNIEGAEWEVLQAAAGGLHNVRQTVIEYHGFPERRQELHDILALLDACGFRYLLHHLDYETNAAVRPPFRVDAQTRFFTLIAAARVWERTVAAPAAPRADAVPVPVSRNFGLDRGRPIDRHYIEQFLAACRDDICGRVLEIGSDAYTRRFGGARVAHRDVLNLVDAPGTTIRADLTQAPSIPDAVYDCVILTQTLPFIFDVQAALRTVERILKPGGVLLLTVPGISPISRYDAERWGDYWRFTPQAVQRLVSERFGTARVEVHIYGNVRAAGALLEGRAVHELRPIELEHTDADYPVIIAARAVKRGLESARAKDAGACGQGASEGAPDAALPSAWDAVADRLDDYPIVSERFRYAVGIRPLLALPADARILEAGCGSGRVLRTLAALGYRRLVGLEISPQRLEQVRRRGPSGVELVCNQGFPFAPASFDAVVSTGVIEHVPNPRGWLARLARVVRPGGIVSLTSDTYMWRWLQKLGLYRSIQPLDRAIWPGTLIRWARAAGLCLTACGGFYNTPEQRRFFLKQLTRLAPGGQRLRWYLHRDEEAVDDTGDETSAIRAALDDWSARVRFGRWWCIGSYESFYWLRRAESAP